MTYHARHAEARLLDLARYFKVVLVVGARQVGKSTLLGHLFPDLKPIVFDPDQDLLGARRDPDLFLLNHPGPRILDEIQHAPELLPALKRRVDSSEARGQYFLTGSQNLALLKTVSESLAGRVGILHLSAMTPRELAREAVDPSWLEPFLSGAAPLPDVLPPPFGADPELFRALWRGCLPGTLDLPDRLVPDYLRSYVETYLERDVRRTADPGDLTAFGRFLGLSAAMTGQESNDSQAGREVGVSPQTARRWYASLSATYQWLEVPPYTRNAVKRVSRRCKGHLHDSGLACHLQRISSPEALSVSPLLGALFETWVHNALRGQFAALAVAPDVLHWRSAGGAEVDLVLERDGMLFPVEVKCKAHPGGHDGRGLRAFRDTYGPDRVRPALLVHGGTDCYRLDPDTWAVPWTRI